MLCYDLTIREVIIEIRFSYMDTFTPLQPHTYDTQVFGNGVRKTSDFFRVMLQNHLANSV